MTAPQTQSRQPENTLECPAVPSLSWPVAAALFWPVALGGAALDLWSKWAVFRWLGSVEGHCCPVINGFLQLILRENQGAAFSLFYGWTIFLVVISTAALVVVIAVFFFAKIQSKRVLFSLGCMTAGIIGNLYDRAFNEGRVRDFIDVYVGSYHWPTFNVADSLLCIGVGLLIIVNLTSTTGQTPDLPQKAAR
ncbi:MAG: signal peptidase II [Planctomycetales bacterium]|nr:signal peptidase II [Planctomycetales bacterium]